MIGIGKEAFVLGFPDYRAPAQRLASEIGCPYADIDVHYFPDGESLVRLPETVPGHAILCRTLSDPNRRLVELEFAAATARRLGADRVTLVAPYLCYMRQDTAFRPGEAISQRIIGAFLARSFDALVTVDPHLHRIGRLQDAMPIDRAVAASAAPVMSRWLARRDWRPLITGPDEESAQWVRRIASAGDYEHCVARKHRHGDRDVIVDLPRRDFAGRDVVLVDDVVSSGHTLAEAALKIADKGAASITALICHAIFAGDALECLESAGVTEIISTDSVLHSSNRLHLAAVLADALARAWSDASAVG
jgi:ribose-phosphate pyrophosphokinase